MINKDAVSKPMAQSQRLKVDSPQRNESPATIVLFSPDMDFCISLRMLFQEKYHVVTTTDPNMLLLTVRAFQPDLLIVDAVPTERMRSRFEILKRENPKVRIMLFYASRFDDDRQLREYFRKSVDAHFSKPLDLMEVTRSIEELISSPKT